MSSELLGGVGLLALLALMILRVPIALSMLTVGVVGFSQVTTWGAAVAMVKSVPVEVLSNYNFSAIPMFILMGVLASYSGMAKKLFVASKSMFGGWRGGMALAAVTSCGAFASISGSSLATASTMSRVALPEMEQNGYASSLATGVLAAGGTLGIMIPPSIALLLYAILTEQPVGDMFLAGLVPGVLGLVFYALTVAIVVRINPGLASAGTPNRLKDKILAALGLIPFLGVFLVIVVGIYAGLFTPTEAASVGAFITMIYAIAKGVRARRICEAIFETVALSSVVFFMIAGAEALGYFISVSRISFEAANYVMGLGLSNLGVLLCIILLYFVLGCFMDAIAMLLLTVPVVYPIISTLGIDPIWFGIVTVLTVELGLITPPVGLNVFMIKAMAPHVGLGEIFKGVMPFIVSDLVRLSLIIIFPAIVTFIII
ncbi:TRAP transporter permease [Halomonas shantousis]